MTLEQQAAETAQIIITVLIWLKNITILGLLLLYTRLCFIKQEEGKGRLIQNIGGGLAKIIFPTNSLLSEDSSGDIIIIEKPSSSYWGFQFKGFYPLFSDYFIPAQKTRIENGKKEAIESSLMPDEEILQTFISKDADGKPNKEEHVVRKRTHANYIRPAISILIPLDDIETGVPEDMKTNFENISVECLIQVVFKVINLRKAINHGGGDFFEILQLGIKSTIETTVAKMDYKHFMQSEDETGGSSALLSKAVLTLNDDKLSDGGSSSYKDQYGIEIVKVTITNRGLSSKSRKIAESLEKTRITQEEAKQAEIVAQGLKQATIIEAEGKSEAQKKLTEGQVDNITKVGEAENNIRKERPVDPDIAAIAKGIENTNGTFVSGSDNPLTPILDIAKKKLKEEPKQENISNPKNKEKDE